MTSIDKHMTGNRSWEVSDLSSDIPSKAQANLREDSDAFFASYVREMLTGLEAAYVAVRENIHDLEAWASLRIIAHKLKASAPLYDYSALGELAATAELAILKDTDQARVMSHALAFLEGVRAADKDVSATPHTAPKAAKLIQLPTASGAIQVVNEASPGRALRPAGEDSHQSVPIRRSKILTAFQSSWMVGYLTRHFEETADVKNLSLASEVTAWSSVNQVDLFVFEHTHMGIDGFNLARQTALRNPMKSAPCLLAFYPGTSGRAVAEAVSLGAHTVIVDETKPRLLAERIEGLLSLKQRRVLLVDDDGPVQKILTDVFAGSGVKLDVAKDGVEALDHLAAHRPDLILLDSIMPRLNGEATLHEIQSRAGMQDIPVIVLTAETRTGSAARWFKRGAVDFITKPFDPEEVVARTLRYLETSH